MSEINWNMSMETGIENIDEQHKMLISVINDFYNEIQKGSSKDRMLHLLKELKKYTDYHFTDEEKYMESVDYPELEKHRKIHESFVKRVSGFEQRFISGKMLLTLEVTNFIKEWIVKHIMDEDKKIADYVNAQK